MIKGKSIFRLIAFSIIGVFLFSTQSLALAYSEKNHSPYREGNGLMLVQKSVMKDKRHHKHSEKKLKEKLDELVKAEVITEDQEEKIIARFKKRHEERKQELKNFEKMTENQQKEYIEQVKKSNEKGIFEEMIDEKIITREQADAVKIVMFKGHKHEFNLDKWKSKLDEQVKAGVITKTEAEKVLEYMKKKAEDKKVQKEKLEKMTPGERKAYILEKKSAPKSNLFDELVEKNILSKDKSEALKKSMHKHHKSNEKYDD